MTSILALTSLIFTGCSGVNTTDPNKAFKYWAGGDPPTDLKLLKAQYWQSPHWTKEYILYLKIKPSTGWWNQYVEGNRLSIDTSAWTTPEGAPNWFRPPHNCIKYNLGVNSGYFRDTINGECFIYEEQL